MAAEELCVSVSGVLTRLTPILNEDGDRVRQRNGYAYMTAAHLPTQKRRPTTRQRHHKRRPITTKRTPPHEPHETTRQKKLRRDTSKDSLLQVLQDAKKERAERFERKMSLLERLVQAVEGKSAQAE
ncbi:hypothetical protein MTO96_028405 [Rhipicephalus appendiculatus]